MIQTKIYHNFQIVRTSVVTETSKVHNDYEFVPTKDTLPIKTITKTIIT